MTAPVDIASTAQLLQEVFPDSEVSRPDYLRWLYEESPFGSVIEANLDDAQGRSGHYALVPIALSVDGEPRNGALSLNTAVHERARGGGVFVGLAREALETARRQGIGTVLGVANANSTPGFVRRLDFSLIGELPATVMISTPQRDRLGVRTTWAAGAGRDTLDAAAGVLASDGAGMARHWNPDSLRWRLRAPGARYALHSSSEVLVVSTLVRNKGVRVAVILKVFTLGVLDAAGAKALVWSAARWHRAPLALHVGLNERFVPRGVLLPRRLRPSPLNLIRRDLTPEVQSRPIVQFELLDFDAY